MNDKHLFPYYWNLADGFPAKNIQKHACKVFGTFICGGGSTMGYKLAGYETLGGVEIDPKVAETYKNNLHPKYLYTEDLRNFNKRTDLPDELFNLDILDGSPPCSTFSLSGNREKAWGKEKVFAEGQKLQTLDDLVFIYCDTIAKLKPKVCLLENVSGLCKGNAKAYAKSIFRRIADIGYNVQLFLLDASTMGVPQRRERCFFIGLRNDFKLPKLQLNFNEAPIYFKEIFDENDKTNNLTENTYNTVWKLKKKTDNSLGDTNKRLYGKNSGFTIKYVRCSQVCTTILTRPNCCYDVPRYLNESEHKQIGSFPMDYKITNKSIPWYVGMSVPPVMMAQISNQIYLQWLSKII